MPKNKQAPGKISVKVCLLVAAALLVLALSGMAFYQYYFDPERAFTGSETVIIGVSHETAEDPEFNSETLNFVLLGFDRIAERDRIYRLFRPDVIILATTDFSAARVKVLSIPRDTLVDIAHRPGQDKINHAYYYGHDLGEGTDSESRHAEGLRYTLDTISYLLEAPIHYFISLDMEGVVEIVDLMGGVYYDVELEIREGLGRGRVLLEPGYQHLDGEGFLHYIHFREVRAESDQGRIGRQQRLLLSTFEQFRKSGKLVRVPAVYKSLTENVETNLTFRQIVALAQFGQELKPGGIEFFSLNGDYQYDEQGIPYFVLDQEQRVDLLRAMLGIEPTLLPQKNVKGM